MRLKFCILLLSLIFSVKIFGHEHSHDVEDVHDSHDPKEFLFVNKHSHGHEHHHEENTSDRPQSTKPWLYSLSAVVAISLAPCVLLFFLPTMNADSSLLRILLAFGAGGLLGDALLHIIPHCFQGHDHHEHHEHHDHSQELKVGVNVVLGILAFMIVEQFVRIAKGGHCHSHNQHHDHVHETQPLKEINSAKTEKPKETTIKATAYLNLVADFVHNLTDGLAIGSSFASGNSIGVLTTVTVLLHELPHEVGDFAILVQSGFTKWQAIRLQMITAVGAILGCVISLCVADPNGLANGASWIMPFTAGGFIYIATVSVIPELLESITSNPNQSKCMQILRSISHILAICTGVGVMYCVSFLE